MVKKSLVDVNIDPRSEENVLGSLLGELSRLSVTEGFIKNSQK